MDKIWIPFVLLAVTGSAALVSSSKVQTAPAVCTIDTASSNYTLQRIEERLDPTDTVAANIDYRSVNGLTGITYAGITIVSDSAKCAAGLRAYARISFPADTLKQATFLDGLNQIFIVRLSANRYLLNANIYSPATFIEQLLVDSTFSIVDVNF